MSNSDSGLSTMYVQGQPVETLQRLRDEAKVELRHKKKSLEVAEATLQIREDLLEYYQKGWSAHLQWLIEHEADHFKELRSQQPKVAEVIEVLYLEAKAAAAESLRRFPALFEKACSEAGLHIDRASRHPRYRVCQSFIEVEVLESSREVRISDREGLLDKMPSDVIAVIQAIQRHNARLFERKFETHDFLKRLYHHYQAILKKENFPDGYDLPIRRITHRLGKNVKGFRTDEFLVDLSRLIREGPLEIDGRRVDLQQTKDERQGVLLHGLESRGYVGFISFKKEAKK